MVKRKYVEISEIYEIVGDINQNNKDINEKDEHGHTLLHLVFANYAPFTLSPKTELLEAIEVVLLAGADPTAVDKQGWVPFQHTRVDKLDDKQRAVLREFNKKYSELLQQHCCIGKLIFHIEMDCLSIRDININLLSITKAEELIKWCDKLITEGIPKTMLCYNSSGALAKLKENCHKQILFLNEFPDLTQTLENFLNPAYEIAIFRSFLLGSELLLVFQHLLEYKNQLNLSSELTIKINTFAESYKAKYKVFMQLKGTPSTLSIEEENITKSLLSDLNRTLIERSQCVGIYQVRQRGVWSQDNLHKTEVQRFLACQPTDQVKRKPVFDELSASTSTAPRLFFANSRQAMTRKENSRGDNGTNKHHRRCGSA